MASTTDRRFDAVVFDFSGVMVSSAFDAIARNAVEHGMSEDEFLEFLLGPYSEDSDHAWHRAERGEIGGYGCATWVGLRVGPEHRQHLTLAELVALDAQAQALAELQAAFLRQSRKDQRELLAADARHEVGVAAQVAHQ